MKWPIKDPNEILDYSVDWSRFLESSVIQSVQWHIEDEAGVKTAVSQSDTVQGLTLFSQVSTNTVATARFGAGLNNTKYKVTCTITYDTHLIAERVVQLPVKER
jgi:hypothetical protein